MTDPFLTSKIPYFVAQIRDNPISHRDNLSHRYLVCTNVHRRAFVFCALSVAPTFADDLISIMHIKQGFITTN